MKSFVKNIIRNFSIHNYGKRLKPEGFSRFHGITRYDEFYDIKNNKYKVKDLQEKETKIAEEVTTKFQHRIDDYFNTSMKRKDNRFEELPEPFGDYLYFTKNGFMGSNNNNYEIIFRRNRHTGKEECILDLSIIKSLRQYQNTAMFVKMVLSDCHNYLAFGVDLESNENVQFFIKDLKRNIILKDKLQGVKNIQFNSDGKSLFYVTHEGNHRTDKLFYHKIGTQQKSDVLLFQELDESYYIDIAVTKDKQYLLVNTASKLNAEIFAVKRRDGLFQSSDLINIFSRNKLNRAFANHSQGKFYVLTDADNVYDFKIMTLDDSKIEQGRINNDMFQYYENFYLPEEGEVLSEIDIFQKNIVLYQKKNGQSQMTVIDIESRNKEIVQLENQFSEISPGVNENYDTDTFRFHVDTPFTYNQVFEYNFKTKKATLLEDAELQGPKFDKSQYVIKSLNASSFDGENIPVTIIHSKDLKKDRKNKLLLHGYGHYGLPIDSQFNVIYLKALEEGWTLAYAHIRGGNEKGWNWHKSAIKENKAISYKDFISCAEFLVSEGYTHPSLMAAYGSSAGGTLVGSAVNMRPELFKAVVLHYPFLDVLTTLLDKSLPLTLSDYDEFGNPIEDKQMYNSISSYCPYENITENLEYPSTLIVCGSDDYRSPLWNVLKYTQRFRDRTLKKSKRVEQFCENNIMVSVTNSGHFGESSVESSIYEKSQQMAFLDYVIEDCNKEVTIE